MVLSVQLQVKFASLDFQNKGVFRQGFLTSQISLICHFVHYFKMQQLAFSGFLVLFPLYFGLDLVCSFILVMPFLCNFDSTYRSRLLRILWSLLGKVFSHLLLGHLPAGCPQKPAACLSFMLVLPGRLLEFHQLQSPQALLPKASETIGSVQLEFMLPIFPTRRAKSVGNLQWHKAGAQRSWSSRDLSLALGKSCHVPYIYFL